MVQCYKCKKYGHYANDCFEIKCYNCGQKGHLSPYCTNRSSSYSSFSSSLSLSASSSQKFNILSQKSQLTSSIYSQSPSYSSTSSQMFTPSSNSSSIDFQQVRLNYKFKCQSLQELYNSLSHQEKESELQQLIQLDQQIDGDPQQSENDQQKTSQDSSKTKNTSANKSKLYEQKTNSPTQNKKEKKIDEKLNLKQKQLEQNTTIISDYQDNQFKNDEIRLMNGKGYFNPIEFINSYFKNQK